MRRSERNAAQIVWLALFALGLALVWIPQGQRPGLVVPFEPLDPDESVPIAIVPGDDSEATVTLAGVRPADAKGQPDRLRITEGAIDRLVPLTPGHTFDIGSRPAYVESVHTWSGILDDPGGTPLATVSLRLEGEWLLRRHVLRPNVPVRLNDAVTLAFRSGASSGRLSSEAFRQPRWAIVDGERIHWFTDFTPGTGLTLDNGTRVTLLARNAAADGQPQHLILLQEGSGEPRQVRVDVGTESGTFWFVAPETGNLHIDIHATPERVATVRVRFPDGTKHTATLEDGDSLSIEDRAFFLAVHRVREHAVAVSPAQSPFFEATLRVDDKSVYVRQGEAVRVDDTMLRYVRRPDFQSTAFDLRIDDSEDSYDVTLNPGDSAEVELLGRPYRIAHGGILPGKHVILESAERPGMLIDLLSLGLLVVGAVGFLASRRRGN